LREIILDTETTGLDPRGGDRLVEIGGVELLNHIPTGRVFHRYLNPERPVPAEAFRVHGLSDAFLADKPRFHEVVEEFATFIDGATLVIHNAEFDVGFLNMELGRLSRPAIPPERVLDTLALARRRHPGGPNSLDALCARYRIDNSGRTKHGALLDAELLADVYIELIGGRQAALGLPGEVGTAGFAGVAIRRRGPARHRPEPLPPRLTEAEAEAHRAFVASLGPAALWLRYLTE
jgi:DNA polymerase-3 subunit epsilon